MLMWQFDYFTYFCHLLYFIKYTRTMTICSYSTENFIHTSIPCLLFGILLRHLLSSISTHSRMCRTKCTISAEDILTVVIKWHTNIIFILFCIMPLQKKRLSISRYLFPSFSCNPNVLFASLFAVVCWSKAFVFHLFTPVLLSLSQINLEFISDWAIQIGLM